MEKADQKSLETEQLVKNFLINTYGELCVHEEIKIANSRQRLDFFVYAKDNFAVDLFNTYTLKNLIINLNAKLSKYKNYPFRLFFVATGTDFVQSEIDVLMRKKINKLPSNIQCVTFEKFKDECKQIHPLKINTNYKSIYQLKLI